MIEKMFRLTPHIRCGLLMIFFAGVYFSFSCGPRLKRVAAEPGNPIILQEMKGDHEAVEDLVRSGIAQYLRNSVSSNVFLNKDVPEEYLQSISPEIERHTITVEASLIMGEKVFSQGGYSETRGRTRRSRSRTTDTGIQSEMIMGFVVSVYKDGVQVESSTLYQKYNRRARYYNPAQMARIMSDRIHRILIKHQLAVPKWRYIPHAANSLDTP